MIDARSSSQYDKSHIDTAISIPHEKLREAAENLDKSVLTVAYSNKSVTGNSAQNILINRGSKKVYNVSGGHRHFQQRKEKS